ncbi:MAG: DUF2892 domain-containing protein [Magnetococcales bacterium]|nr:DUF2892 domain-containing protein [Magnetococcales bacterium]
MKQNVGAIDRSMRIVVGVVLISGVLMGPQTPWGWLGVIPLVTGFVRFCPLYLPFGVGTCFLFGVNTCSTGEVKGG